MLVNGDHVFLRPHTDSRERDEEKVGTVALYCDTTDVIDTYFKQYVGGRTAHAVVFLNAKPRYAARVVDQVSAIFAHLEKEKLFIEQKRCSSDAQLLPVDLTQKQHVTSACAVRVLVSN